MYLSSHPPVEIPKWFSPWLRFACMATGALFYDVTHRRACLQAVHRLHTVCLSTCKISTAALGRFCIGQHEAFSRPTRLPALQPGRRLPPLSLTGLDQQFQAALQGVIGETFWKGHI